MKNLEGFATISYAGPSPSFLKEIEGFPTQLFAGFPSKVTAEITFKKDNKYLVYSYEGININRIVFNENYEEAIILRYFLEYIKKDIFPEKILDLRLSCISEIP
jgi:hypothetical protein